MKEKVVIVTGSSSGIGRAAALAFGSAGCKVVLSDINPDKDTEELIKQSGGEAFYIPCDVSKESQVSELIDACKDRYGKLDFAFNNAGISGVSEPVGQCSDQNWEQTIGINLSGVFYCMKYQIGLMLENGGGSIVNNASVAGLVGFARANPAYVASKHAVVGLTKSAALDYATLGIRINAVCPGIIKTPIITNLIETSPEIGQQLTYATPMARLGTSEEIANLVLFLCSENASFITGQAIAADGGWIVQ